MAPPFRPVSAKVRIRPGKRRSLRQLLDIQQTLYEASGSKEITPSALAQVARAWSDLEERKRVLRMKPAPKPVDVTPKVPKHQLHSTMREL